MAKFLDSNGLLYLWGKIKALVPTKTSDLQNDSGYITAAEAPAGVQPSTTSPKMDGVAAVGTQTAFARGDHVHPSDTSKVDKETGKGLSANDYTTEEKDKLAGIADGANKYVLPQASAATLGGVKLSSATDSTSETLAATPKAVKAAYDLAAGKQNKATTLAGYGITDAYTKTEVDGKLSGGVHYKTTVENYAALPTSGQTTGDMYNVKNADKAHGVKAGDNVVWNGTDWDVLSGTVDLSGCVMQSDAITNADIDAIVAT